MSCNPKHTAFKSARYVERGYHLEKMRRRQFARTPVNDVIDEVWKENKEYVVKKLWFGDPAAYTGLDAYEGVHRFLRRWINFHKPSDYSQYMIAGYGPLKQQIRMGSTRRDENYIAVPPHAEVFFTPGVAGALKIICDAVFLPPKDEKERDNAVMPQLTYLSHSAEVSRAQADIRTCRLGPEGQLDIDHLQAVIDSNTRAVILATVGNPLSIAMHPDLFDQMLMVVNEKEKEYQHSIIVIADVIYEHFRRNLDEKIDSVQRVLRLTNSMDLDVPIIETSSFSKMMAMAGQRIGYFRIFWRPDTKYRDEREDVLTALNAVYGTTLNPVSSLLQKTIGELYIAINSGLPREEELAPIAAVLTAMKELAQMKGAGDSFTMLPDEVPSEIIANIGLEPTEWFTTSAIAKRTRKIANETLGCYNIDMDTSRVVEIGARLRASSLIEIKEVEVERQKLINILVSSVIKHDRLFARKLDLAVKAAGLSADDAQLEKMRNVLSLPDISSSMSIELLQALNPELKDDLANLINEFKLANDGKSSIKMTFYRLISDVPELERKNGQLHLYGISGSPATNKWREIADKCGIPKENDLYEAFKDGRRKEVYSRVDYFVSGLEAMRREHLGIYLHPSYYLVDSEGKFILDDHEEQILDIERINGFYILWGFRSLKNNPCQAAEVASLCYASNLPILANTPGELFVPESERSGDDSYIRTVGLNTKEEIDAVLAIIRQLAMSLVMQEAKDLDRQRAKESK